MSNEVKIGILALVAIGLSFWGYKFILGKNVLVKSNIYKIMYDQVDGLQVGTQARINGVRVGSVASIQLVPEENEKVLVTLDLNKDQRIPKNTKAVIISTGFMGGKAINLVYDKPCSGGDCAQSGDYIQGQTLGLLGSMMGTENMKEYVNILKDGLSEVMDTLNNQLLSEESNSPLAKSVRDLQGTLANLNSTTGQLDRLMRSSSGQINGTLTNLNAITGSIEKQKGSIERILANADSLSAQLATANLKKTLAEVESTIASLKATLGTADQAMGGFASITDKINNGEGTLGKLVKDEQLYHNITRLSQSMDSLLVDLQERPYRYVPLKGRKRVKRYDRKDGKE